MGGSGVVDGVIDGTAGGGGGGMVRAEERRAWCTTGNRKELSNSDEGLYELRVSDCKEG